MIRDRDVKLSCGIVMEVCVLDSMFSSRIAASVSGGLTSLSLNICWVKLTDEPAVKVLVSTSRTCNYSPPDSLEPFGMASSVCMLEYYLLPL